MATEPAHTIAKKTVELLWDCIDNMYLFSTQDVDILISATVCSPPPQYLHSVPPLPLHTN